MDKILLLFSIFAVLVSCGAPAAGDREKPSSAVDSVVLKKTSEAIPFEDFFDPFIRICPTINSENINSFIDKEHGLWLITSSGAMPGMTKTSQVDKNFPVDFSGVKPEELPRINCDSKSFWTKEGCFVQEINSFKNEKIWTYCGLSKEDEIAVSKLAEGISWTVVNTSLSARYYFSRINDKWCLSFVDLRAPCQA